MSSIIDYFKDLTLKKILILVFIGLFLLIITIDLLSKAFTKVKKDPDIKVNPYDTFVSSDSQFEVSLSKEYKLADKTSPPYILKIKSDENKITILLSEHGKIDSSSLRQIAEGDKKMYSSKFNSMSNVSDLYETNILENKQGYTYSFNYVKNVNGTDETYYFQTIWFETDSSYFIIDIEFPQGSLESNAKLINDFLKGLKMSS